MRRCLLDLSNEGFRILLEYGEGSSGAGWKDDVVGLNNSDILIRRELRIARSPVGGKCDGEL
jgi:hypothetical protein